MIGVYFSGTGNTKYLAKCFLEEYEGNAKLHPIEENGTRQKIEKAEEILLAYPIYYSNLPKILRDYLEETKELWAGKKVYLLATMGLFSGDGAGCAARLLRKYGAEIRGGIHAKMPDCISDEKALKRTLEKNQETVAMAEKKIRDAVHRIKEGRQVREGLGIFSHAAGLFGQRLWFYGMTRRYFSKLKIDREKCVGCKICAALCPMSNLKPENGSIQIGNRCTMCYRCVNHCPKQAITLLGNHVIEQSLLEKYLK